MKVNVIGGNGLSASQAFKALIYEPPTQEVQEYLQQSFNKVMDVAHTLSSGFVENITSVYNKVNDSNVVRATKSLLSKYGDAAGTNTIRVINQDNIPNVNPIMQRYIMANPKVYDLYKDNMCNGFVESYTDTDPNDEPKQRLDYERVMDGIMEFDDDTAIVTTYSSSHEEDDLDVIEKFNILETWDNVEYMIANDIDPTDPELNSL